MSATRAAWLVAKQAVGIPDAQRQPTADEPLGHHGCICLSNTSTV